MTGQESHGSQGTRGRVGAGCCDLLYDQVSKLSGRFSLLANAGDTTNFFRKLQKILADSEIFERFRNFWKLQKFRNAFRNAGTRTTSLLEHSTNNHDKKTSVSYITFGIGPKSVLVVKNLPNFSEISEHTMKLPKFLEGFRN